MVTSRRSVSDGTPEQRRSAEPLLCKNEKTTGYHVRTGWLYQRLRPQELSKMKILKSIYYHPWFPRLFFIKSDGGPESGVRAYLLVEWKLFFSIGLLHFRNGSRKNFHSHAFNAISWFIWGSVTEEHLKGDSKEFRASLIPKITKRDCFHRVISHGDTWCVTIRGPWTPTWWEYRPDTNVFVELTHGRKEAKAP
jgi:hypothetical protein